jgi:hypothetical protein
MSTSYKKHKIENMIKQIKMLGGQNKLREVDEESMNLHTITS